MTKEEYLSTIIPYDTWIHDHEKYVKRAFCDMKDYFRADDFVSNYKARASETILRNILADSWENFNGQLGEFENNVARLTCIPYEDIVEYRTEKFWKEVARSQY